MPKLVPGHRPGQARVIGLTLALSLCVLVTSLPAAEPADKGSALSEKEMQRYAQQISGTDVAFDMVPIPGLL